MTKIKKARLALGITATEAARRIGISRQRYSLYERGTYEANYEMLLRIAEVFGVTVDWLLNRESAPADVRRSAVVGRIMSMSDEEISAMYKLLEQLTSQAAQPATTAAVPLPLPDPDAERVQIKLAPASDAKAAVTARLHRGASGVLYEPELPPGLAACGDTSGVVPVSEFSPELVLPEIPAGAGSHKTPKSK